MYLLLFMSLVYWTAMWQMSFCLALLSVSSQAKTSLAWCSGKLYDEWERKLEWTKEILLMVKIQIKNFFEGNKIIIIKLRQLKTEIGE